MRSSAVNGEGELRGQPANTGSPGKMAVKIVCVFNWSLSILTAIIQVDVGKPKPEWFQDDGSGDDNWS